jgi:aryl carrier-like protein
MGNDEKKSILKDAWKEVLGVETAGDDDNFFEAGGDSIKAVQLVGWLVQKGLKLDMLKIYTNPVLSELSDMLEETTPMAVPSEMLNKENLNSFMNDPTGSEILKRASDMGYTIPGYNAPQQLCTPEQQAQAQQLCTPEQQAQAQQLCTPVPQQQYAYMPQPIMMIPVMIPVYSWPVYGGYYNYLNPAQPLTPGQLCTPGQQPQQLCTPVPQQLCTPGQQPQQLCTPGPQPQQLCTPVPQQLCSPGQQPQQLCSPGPQPQQLCSPGPQPQQLCTPGPQPQQLCTPGQQAQTPYMAIPVEKPIDNPNTIKINEPKLGKVTQSPEAALDTVLRGIFPQGYDRSRNLVEQGMTSFNFMQIITRCAEQGYRVKLVDIVKDPVFDKIVAAMETE